jgi:hypothetical protein
VCAVGDETNANEAAPKLLQCWCKRTSTESNPQFYMLSVTLKEILYEEKKTYMYSPNAIESIENCSPNWMWKIALALFLAPLMRILLRKSLRIRKKSKSYKPRHWVPGGPYLPKKRQKSRATASLITVGSLAMENRVAIPCSALIFTDMPKYIFDIFRILTTRRF